MQPLKAVMVGCTGPSHARALGELDEFDFAAVADVRADRAGEFAAAHAVAKTYTDYAEMLKQERAAVVTIRTPNSLHAEMTALAAESGARGVCCEKPMAVDLAEARRMVEVCRRNGTALIISHQRRMSAPLRRMRELIEDGAIGRLRLLRGHCAGDMLSDGTHLVDTIRHLNGDRAVRWVFGQICRNPRPAPQGAGVQMAREGWRYGHPVESGAAAVLEFTNDVRAEILTGELRPPDWAYCDFEAWGTEGRLWRNGDSADPPLLIDSGSGWQPVEFGEPASGREAGETLWSQIYRQLARMIHEGARHPLAGDSALVDQEVLMAIYESARTHARVKLPLRETRFPLQLMIDAGQI